MSESQVIKGVNSLQTVESIKKDLKNLGLKEGMTIIVHSSLSSLGWVCGGAVSVIQALMDVVTMSGNIIMPTQSSNYSDPKYWGNPPVPKEWWEGIRDNMPAYEEEITPSIGVGVVCEVFRNYPEVKRSSHPQVSFAAWGKDRDYILKNQPLNYALGENSPLEKIYKLDGHVLLIGVDYTSNTSFHLSEYYKVNNEIYKDGAPIMIDGKRAWVEFEEIEMDEDIFNDIGNDFEKEYKINEAYVGNANTKLFKQRQAVNFAKEWFLKSEIK